MPTFRFNHLFSGLLGLSFLTAFVLPARVTTPGFGQLQGLFSPVSRPVRLVVGFVYRQIHREQVVDFQSPTQPREAQRVYQENEDLRSAYATLQKKFEQLSQLNADRQAVGDIRSLCTPATVTAADPSGLRETLTISIGQSSSLLVDRPVVRGNPSQSPLPCDLIGRIDRAGVAGARVRLVTDPGFTFSARIGRYEPQSDGHLRLIVIDKINPLIRGIGSNQMIVASNLSMKQVQDLGITKEDLILLDDHDNKWPANVQYFSVGKIDSIGHQPKSALLAEIRIKPSTNLMQLTEVMVMVRD